MPLTDSEAYLAKLAERSFLSMWSYPNPGFGPPGNRAKGKELCDLMVVFDNTVILFSDKDCEYPSSGDPDLDWRRWYKRAVSGGVKQLKGAKRTLLQQPEKLHADLSLQLKFPLELPDSESMKIHLVAVAHGTSAACNLHWGRPSLQVDTAIAGDESVLTIGCLFDDEFVHVFDDSTLDVILSQRDTLPDFIHYLEQKEEALHASQFVVPGEENLLAHYLKSRDASGEHFIPAISDGSDAGNQVDENAWSEYSTSAGHEASVSANRISYNIDLMIEHFTLARERGEMIVGQDLSKSKHESALRLLASESRFGRRIIGSGFTSIFNEPETHTFWASTVPSVANNDVRLVFMTYPEPPKGFPIEQMEHSVLKYMSRHLLVARGIFREQSIVIGIAVANRDCSLRSHFIRILDGRDWTLDDFTGSAELQAATGIFSNMIEEKTLHFE
jgi:hypothetical protein